MAIVNDEMKEDLDYCSLLDSLNSNFNEEVPSLEDVAWADSCLNKDVESSNADWSSIEDALLEILISLHGPSSFAVAESSGQPSNAEILYSRENETSQEFGRESEVDEDFVYDVRELKSIESEDDEDNEDDDDVLRNKHGKVKGKGRIRNVFRPNYTENIASGEKLDSDLDLGLTTYEVEPLTEDIFKVWDLEVSDELDDFTKQLNKALSDFCLQSQSNDDDLTSLKEFTTVSVDDLIAGVGGLSLMQNTE